MSDSNGQTWRFNNNVGSNQGPSPAAYDLHSETPARYCDIE